MKKKFFILIAIAALAAALTTNASGQTGTTLRAKVTFDFQIGDRFYPAGKYLIESGSGQSDNILQIRSLGGGNISQLILANSSNAGKTQRPRLIFRKHGARYFLTQIFLNSEQWGHSIPTSSRQRASESQLASRVTRNN